MSVFLVCVAQWAHFFVYRPIETREREQFFCVKRVYAMEKDFENSTKAQSVNTDAINFIMDNVFDWDSTKNMTACVSATKTAKRWLNR